MATGMINKFAIYRDCFHDGRYWVTVGGQDVTTIVGDLMHMGLVAFTINEVELDRVYARVSQQGVKYLGELNATD